MTDAADLRRAEADARHAALMERTKVRAAEAKTPKEWMELFQAVCEHSVKTTMEQQGDGHKVLDQLAPWRSGFTNVARELQAHGMPLTDRVEVTGPQMGHTKSGIPVVDAWPQGVWVKFHWPDESVVKFTGNDAIVAVSFWTWWCDFQVVHEKQMGISRISETASRLILPGSPDSLNYHNAKRQDPTP